MSFNYLINAAKHKLLKPALEEWPAAYIAVQKVRYRNWPYYNNLVDRDTDITIEGFPRCANGFSVQAFRHVHKDRTYKMAHHLHAYAQVVRSVQLGIPTICLIRTPEEAVVSVAAMMVQIKYKTVETFLKERNIRWYIEYYNRFYAKLLPYADQMVVAAFPEVISDFGNVMARVNARYGTDFAMFNHTKEYVDRFFQKSRVHASPSEEREGIKERLRPLVDTEHCRRLLARAEGLYGQWMEVWEKEVEGIEIAIGH